MSLNLIKPWDKLTKILPPLSAGEEKTLRASIAEHGQQQPILILPDGKIIDGSHRYKILNGKVDYKTLDISEEIAFNLGIALNLARRNLSSEQIVEIQKELAKDKEARVKVALELRKAGKSQEEVAGIVGVAQQTVDNWENITITKNSNGYILPVPDLRVKIPREERKAIAERVKKGETQAQVAADYKVSQPSIAKALKAQKASQRMKPKFDRLKEIEESGIYIGSVWSYGARKNYAGDPKFHGNSPTQIVENSILLYTKKGDMVLDPMAGSGTTLDVCKKLDRKYIASDIKPVREDIAECDARRLKNGTFGIFDESIDFIFLHPPYWKMVSYTKPGEKDGDLSQLEYQPFLAAMEDVFRECHRVLKDKKVLCLLIGDLVRDGIYKPIAIPLYNQAAKLMTPIGIAMKTTKGSQSQIVKGKTIWAEVAYTNNLKIEHDFIMLFRKDATRQKS